MDITLETLKQSVVLLFPLFALTFAAGPKFGPMEQGKFVLKTTVAVVNTKTQTFRYLTVNRTDVRNPSNWKTIFQNVTVLNKSLEDQDEDIGWTTLRTTSRPQASVISKARAQDVFVNLTTDKPKVSTEVISSAGNSSGAAGRLSSPVRNDTKSPNGTSLAFNSFPNGTSGRGASEQRKNESRIDGRDVKPERFDGSTEATNTSDGSTVNKTQSRENASREQHYNVTGELTSAGAVFRNDSVSNSKRERTKLKGSIKGNFSTKTSEKGGHLQTPVGTGTMGKVIKPTTAVANGAKGKDTNKVQGKNVQGKTKENEVANTSKPHINKNPESGKTSGNPIGATVSMKHGSASGNISVNGRNTGLIASESATSTASTGSNAVMIPTVSLFTSVPTVKSTKNELPKPRKARINITAGRKGASVASAVMKHPGENSSVKNEASVRVAPARVLLYPSTQSPLHPTAKISPHPSALIPLHPTTPTQWHPTAQTPLHSTTQMPLHISTPNPLRTSMQSPLRPSPQIPSHQSPQIPSHQSPQIPSHQSPQIPSHQSPQIPSHQSTKIPSHPSSKIQSHPSTKIQSHPSTKIQLHPSTKIQLHPSTKIPSHPSTQTPLHRQTTMLLYTPAKIQLHPADQIPLNPSAQIDLKMNSSSNENMPIANAASINSLHEPPGNGHKTFNASYDDGKKTGSNMHDGNNSMKPSPRYSIPSPEVSLNVNFLSIIQSSEPPLTLHATNDSKALTTTRPNMLNLQAPQQISPTGKSPPLPTNPAAAARDALIEAEKPKDGRVAFVNKQENSNSSFPVKSTNSSHLAGLKTPRRSEVIKDSLLQPAVRKDELISTTSATNAAANVTGNTKHLSPELTAASSTGVVSHNQSQPISISQTHQGSSSVNGTTKQNITTKATTTLKGTPSTTEKKPTAPKESQGKKANPAKAKALISAVNKSRLINDTSEIKPVDSDRNHPSFPPANHITIANVSKAYQMPKSAFQNVTSNVAGLDKAGYVAGEPMNGQKETKVTQIRFTGNSTKNLETSHQLDNPQDDASYNKTVQIKFSNPKESKVVPLQSSTVHISPLPSHVSTASISKTTKNSSIGGRGNLIIKVTTKPMAQVTNGKDGKSINAKLPNTIKDPPPEAATAILSKAVNKTPGERKASVSNNSKKPETLQNNRATQTTPSNLPESQGLTPSILNNTERPPALPSTTTYRSQPVINNTKTSENGKQVLNNSIGGRGSLIIKPKSTAQVIKGKNGKSTNGNGPNTIKSPQTKAATTMSSKGVDEKQNEIKASISNSTKKFETLQKVDTTQNGSFHNLTSTNLTGSQGLTTNNLSITVHPSTLPSTTTHDEQTGIKNSNSSENGKQVSKDSTGGRGSLVITATQSSQVNKGIDGKSTNSIGPSTIKKAPPKVSTTISSKAVGKKPDVRKASISNTTKRPEVLKKNETQINVTIQNITAHSTLSNLTETIKVMPHLLDGTVRPSIFPSTTTPNNQSGITNKSHPENVKHTSNPNILSKSSPIIKAQARAQVNKGKDGKSISEKTLNIIKIHPPNVTTTKLSQVVHKQPNESTASITKGPEILQKHDPGKNDAFHNQTAQVTPSNIPGIHGLNLLNSTMRPPTSHNTTTHINLPEIKTTEGPENYKSTSTKRISGGKVSPVVTGRPQVTKLIDGKSANGKGPSSIKTPSPKDATTVLSKGVNKPRVEHNLSNSNAAKKHMENIVDKTDNIIKEKSMNSNHTNFGNSTKIGSLIVVSKNMSSDMTPQPPTIPSANSSSNIQGRFMKPLLNGPVSDNGTEVKSSVVIMSTASPANLMSNTSAHQGVNKSGQDLKNGSFARNNATDGDISQKTIKNLSSTENSTLHIHQNNTHLDSHSQKLSGNFSSNRNHTGNGHREIKDKSSILTQGKNVQQTSRKPEFKAKSGSANDKKVIQANKTAPRNSHMHVTSTPVHYSTTTMADVSKTTPGTVGVITGNVSVQLAHSNRSLLRTTTSRPVSATNQDGTQKEAAGYSSTTPIPTYPHNVVQWPTTHFNARNASTFNKNLISSPTTYKPVKTKPDDPKKAKGIATSMSTTQNPQNIQLRNFTTIVKMLSATAPTILKTQSSTASVVVKMQSSRAPIIILFDFMPETYQQQSPTTVEMSSSTAPSAIAPTVSKNWAAIHSYTERPKSINTSVPVAHPRLGSGNNNNIKGNIPSPITIRPEIIQTQENTRNDTSNYQTAKTTASYLTKSQELTPSLLNSTARPPPLPSITTYINQPIINNTNNSANSEQASNSSIGGGKSPIIIATTKPTAHVTNRKDGKLINGKSLTTTKSPPPKAATAILSKAVDKKPDERKASVRNNTKKPEKNIPKNDTFHNQTTQTPPSNLMESQGLMPSILNSTARPPPLPSITTYINQPIINNTNNSGNSEQASNSSIGGGESPIIIVTTKPTAQVTNRKDGKLINGKSPTTIETPPPKNATAILSKAADKKPDERKASVRNNTKKPEKIIPKNDTFHNRTTQTPTSHLMESQGLMPSILNSTERPPPLPSTTTNSSQPVINNTKTSENGKQVLNNSIGGRGSPITTAKPTAQVIKSKDGKSAHGNTLATIKSPLPYASTTMSSKGVDKIQNEIKTSISNSQGVTTNPLNIAVTDYSKNERSKSVKSSVPVTPPRLDSGNNTNGLISSPRTIRPTSLISILTIPPVYKNLNSEENDVIGDKRNGPRFKAPDSTGSTDITHSVTLPKFLMDATTSERTRADSLNGVDKDMFKKLQRKLSGNNNMVASTTGKVWSTFFKTVPIQFTTPPPPVEDRNDKYISFDGDVENEIPGSDIDEKNKKHDIDDNPKVGKHHFQKDRHHHHYTATTDRSHGENWKLEPKGSGYAGKGRHFEKVPQATDTNKQHPDAIENEVLNIEKPSAEKLVADGLVDKAFSGDERKLSDYDGIVPSSPDMAYSSTTINPRHIVAARLAMGIRRVESDLNRTAALLSKLKKSIAKSHGKAHRGGVANKLNNSTRFTKSDQWGRGFIGVTPSMTTTKPPKAHSHHHHRHHHRKNRKHQPQYGRHAQSLPVIDPGGDSDEEETGGERVHSTTSVTVDDETGEGSSETSSQKPVQGMGRAAVGAKKEKPKEQGVEDTEVNNNNKNKKSCLTVKEFNIIVKETIKPALEEKRNGVACPPKLPCQLWGSCTQLWKTGLIKDDLSIDEEWEVEYFELFVSRLLPDVKEEIRSFQMRCYDFYGLREPFGKKQRKKREPKTEAEAKQIDYTGLTDCRARILDLQECFGYATWKALCKKS